MWPDAPDSEPFELGKLHDWPLATMEGASASLAEVADIRERVVAGACSARTREGRAWRSRAHAVSGRTRSRTFLGSSL